jgi:DNA polymerase III alpha subunit
LLAIRGVGLSVYKAIEDLRPFHSIEDFMNKVPKSSVKSNVRKALWYIGAFDGVAGTFDQLEAGEEEVLNKAQIQSQYFDYVILPKDKIDQIYEYASKKSCIGVGLVAKVENKVSKKGNAYRLVTLLPQTIEGKINVARVFDDGLSIEAGQILAFRGDSGIVLRGSDNMREL